MILVYDDTFDGLLSAIFDSYLYKFDSVEIRSIRVYQPEIFNKTQEVITDEIKVKRLQKKLLQLFGISGLHKIFKAFLSESQDVENLLFYIIKTSISNNKSILNDAANDIVLSFDKLVKKVHREKHRMEAFVRFHLIEGDIYYANIEPDFNVLPLISKHFKSRYADQKWIIYDLKRSYGIFYDLKTVKEITIDLTTQNKKGIYNTIQTGQGVKNLLTTKQLKENNYTNLWNQYFKSTNIEYRKNLKLHIQHVPKRYWKYLSEKV
ncbi:TIGR03915 family putative DNA repair protein [Nonlabens sp. SY33080]|uniref:TIGR03915 family putative DNA repair protein n=1 Tax=Nonlabens sp. SY33080 TaxID=2719911 RepID=UPI001428BEF6|nr:TIGR03915 family putative DNA repair protein [Nonlabens sp. SY33080]